MKLLKQLLVAPAALGLLAPMAASAAEINLDGVNQYASDEQVTSISQFPDVQPTDWAYQALANLIERYGCVAGYPDGTFKGQRAMTRFEAAALLNACLDRVTEVTDELKRLMAEFERELAILKGRVDGLEAKVGELEANQFSTTTKLRGEASFILGGTPDFESPLRNSDGTRAAKPNEVTFNYDLRLSFDTSFTGKDLLRTRLRSGNFSSLPFGSSSQIFKLDKAESTDDSVEIDRLFYRFPVGESFRVTVGALVRNTEMLSFIPSAYNSSILDFFQLAGASGTYNKGTGAGFGVSWRQQVEKGNPYVTFDANYVSENGYDDSSVGAFTEESGINFLTQLGVKSKNWGAAVAYRYGSEGSNIRVPNFSPRTVGSGGDTNSIAFGAYWQPIDAGWVPSISAGYGYNWGDGGFRDSQSWMAGLQWSDVFLEGSTAGFAVGMPPFTSSGETESWLYELFYKFQVTDNISITPALFYASDYRNNRGNDTWGGVIQTTFKF
ncbi:carbohydrate porin [Cyanobium sp. ATX 6A2]|uniref:iron uptake porin n=1 Tax=Cyanobium sp. ATX 6A2 TaxID=2823700 RepID=UPI0020CF3224|nr:iron uptake porin [Cyanobium sp. ATX 6A2]MCP9888482.1 carbohydrate porin [Cyanobium sp. ATX 6A2]